MRVTNWNTMAKRGMAAAASTILANDRESIGKRRSTENSRNRDSS
jgi:hypothetical protein